MTRGGVFTAAAVLTCGIGWGVWSPDVAGQSVPSPAPSMNFFVTSKGLGDGGNLGGLAGADYHCQQLAGAVGSQRTFYAYLSTRPANGTTTLHGRDRIGKGPFFNAKGVMVAKSVEDLHGAAAGLTKETALTEKGELVAMHDIITGSQPDGTAYTDGKDHTCNGYTSNRSIAFGAAWAFRPERRVVLGVGAPEQGVQPGRSGKHGWGRAVLLLCD